MAKKFFGVLQKNFKVMWRSRTLALLVLGAPLVMVLLVGMAFNNSDVYAIKIGVYSENYDNELTTSLLELLAKDYTIRRFHSEDECINSIKQGISNICMTFPKDLDLKSNEASNEIFFHVDYSKTNLVWMILDTISTKLMDKSSEYSEELTNVLLKKLENANSGMLKLEPVISDAHTENSNMINKLHGVSDELGSFDLSLNKSGFKTDDMYVTNSEMLQTAVEVKTNVKAVKKKLELLGNFSGSGTENITAMLDNATSGLDSIITGGYAQFGSLITDVKKNLEKVEEKLIIATLARNSANSEIAAIQSMLNSTIGKLTTINSTILGVIDDINSIEVTNASKIVNPITTTIKRLGPEGTYLTYIFPTLLVLIIMFTSVLLSSTFIIAEKRSRAFFRNFISPTQGTFFVITRYVTDAVAVLAQIGLFMLVSVFFMKVEIGGGLLSAAVSLLAIITIFIFLGMVIGCLVNSNESGVLASISVCSIMFFLSNTIIPIESMSEYIGNVVKFNPFVISELSLRSSFIYQLGFNDILTNLYLIIIYSIVLFVVVLGLVKASQYLFMQKCSSFLSRKLAIVKGVLPIKGECN